MRKGLKAVTLVVGTLFSCLSAGHSESMRIEYVQLDDSSKPILEIHARGADPLKGRGGHAFVLLGRQYPDDSIKYYQGAGFYPEKGTDTGQTPNVVQEAIEKVQTLKAYFKTPGHIDFTPEDNTSDISFRVKIAGTQENSVKFLIKNWNEKEYRVLSQNCISLVKAVGKSVGLDVGDPKSLDGLPYDVVRLIKNENDEDRALRYAIREHELAVQQGVRDSATIRGAYQKIAKDRQDRQDKINSINRLNHGMSPSGPSSLNSGGGSDVSASSLPCVGDACFTYPWPSPKR
jgi:hypothetical protein